MEMHALVKKKKMFENRLKLFKEGQNSIQDEDGSGRFWEYNIKNLYMITLLFLRSVVIRFLQENAMLLTSTSGNHHSF